MGVLGLDLVTEVDLVLQILGAAPTTCVQQPPRVRGHLLICGVVWEGAHQHLQDRELNMGTREKCAVRDANTFPGMLPVDV